MVTEPGARSFGYLYRCGWAFAWPIYDHVWSVLSGHWVEHQSKGALVFPTFRKQVEVPSRYCALSQPCWKDVSVGASSLPSRAPGMRLEASLCRPGCWLSYFTTIDPEGYRGRHAGGDRRGGPAEEILT